MNAEKRFRPGEWATWKPRRYSPNVIWRWYATCPGCGAMVCADNQPDLKAYARHHLAYARAHVVVVA